ncbi:hypothetical protein ACQPX6_08580 [Actinomycetospora sp. CA-101289]|uniref:hypothetical protein n=1 Tax=Actinomycetospora sp. CA-101289 TaxID=3239893 RepID=UPI003D963FD3
MALRRSEIRPSSRRSRSSTPPARVVLATSAAALLAVLGHLVGSGNVTTSCALLLTALGASAVTTTAAAWVAHRTRGSSAALAILTLNQLVTEATLSIPAHDMPAAPLAGALVHGLAVVAVLALLMGTTRTFRPVALVVRRWLPASFSVAPPYPPTRAVSACGHRLLGDGLLEGFGPRAPRGPPALHIAPPHP